MSSLNTHSSRHSSSFDSSRLHRYWIGMVQKMPSIFWVFLFVSYSLYSNDQPIISNVTSDLIPIAYRAQDSDFSSCQRDLAAEQNYVSIRLTHVFAYRPWTWPTFKFDVVFEYILVGDYPAKPVHHRTFEVPMDGRKEKLSQGILWIHKVPLTNAHLTINVILVPRNDKDEYRTKSRELVYEVASKYVGVFFDDHTKSVADTGRELSLELYELLRKFVGSIRVPRYLLRREVYLPRSDRAGEWCEGYHALFGTSKQAEYLRYTSGGVIWDTRMDDLLLCEDIGLNSESCESVDRMTHVVIDIRTSERFFPSVSRALDGDREWAKIYTDVFGDAMSLLTGPESTEYVKKEMHSINKRLMDAYDDLSDDLSIIHKESLEIHTYVVDFVTHIENKALKRIGRSDR